MKAFRKDSEVLKWPLPRSLEATRVHLTGIAFESTWLFRGVLILGIFRYTDYWDISERAGALVKYYLFVILLAVLITAAARTKKWLLGWNAPTIILLFTFFACAPLLSQLAQGQSPDSYSSAFCSSLVYSMTVFYNLKVVNFSVVQRRLVLWLFLMGLFYIGELLVRIGAPGLFLASEGTNQMKIITVLIGIYFTTLAGEQIFMACFFIIYIAFLILRPTSSMVFCMLACMPIIILIRNAKYRLAECICYLILLALSISPFFIYMSGDASNIVNVIESFVKAEALGGSSNTQVRLDILMLAFERWEESSLFFGEMFMGGTKVFLGQWWSSFTETGLIPIHSDYLIILVESGLVGYITFNLAFIWIIRSHFRWLRRQARCKGNLSAQHALVAIAIPVTITLAIICSANPYLQYYGLLLVVWFILMCSQLCKSRGGRELLKIRPAERGLALVPRCSQFERAPPSPESEFLIRLRH